MEEVIEELEEHMEFNELTQDQLDAFKEEMAPIEEKAKENLGEEEWNKIIDEIQEIEAELGIE